MNFQREKLSECVNDIEILANGLYDELYPYKDIPLNVDWEKFVMLDRSGHAHTYTARKEDGSISAFAVFYVHISLECQVLQASLAHIFINKEDRGYGKKFISWCEDQLKEYNVELIFHHVKTYNNYGSLLEKLGYEEINIEYVKRLNRE